MIDLQISKSVFNDIYFPYLQDYSHKYEIYYGGAGSGKSVFIAQKLIIKACTEKRRILVIRKTGVSLKESCWRLILQILSQWKIYSYCKINKSDFTIEFPNGSTILMKGLDDPEKIKSIQGITDCWIEESTELNEEDFDQLTLRLREQVGNTQFFLSFNPVSKVNFCYKRWFVTTPPPDTLIIHSTYKDNKFLTQDYINTLESQINTNPTYYKIYALGEFASLDKLVYPLFTEGEPPEDKTGMTFLVGLDFGYINDPTAMVCSWLDEHNHKLYVVDEFCRTGMLNNEIAIMIQHKGYAKEVIIADSAEQKSIEEIKRSGVPRIKPAVKGKDSIVSGIQKIQQYQLVVSQNCPNVKVELENYSWEKDKKTNEYTNTPVDSWNHCLDALRYSIQTQQNKLKTISKNSLGL